MSFRAIAVTRSPEFAARLDALLGETADLELGPVVGDARDVIRESTRESTHLVLVDFAMVDPAPLEVTRELQGKLPHLAILLVVQRSSPELLDEALTAGARNVLSLQDSFEDIRTKAVGAAQWADRVQTLHQDTGALHLGSSRVVVFAGSKGGVGTTTLAVHAARSLAADRRKVCLVDLDLTKGDVAHYLDIPPGHDASALAQLQDAPPAQAVSDILYNSPTGLRVLCAPDEPERAEEISDDLVRDVLVALRQMFEVIVVDAGSMITGALGSALEVSDRTVVVSTPDLVGTRGANRIIALNERLKLSDPELVSVLVNRGSAKSYVQPAVMRRMVTAPLLPVVVADHGLALESATNGRDPSLVTDRKFLRSMAQLAATVSTADDETRNPRPGVAGKRDERGIVTVEFMALVPLLLIILAGLLQAVVYAAASFQAGTAAEAAAHACARDDAPEPAAQAEARPAFADALTVGACQEQGGLARAEVTVRVHSVVPEWLMGPRSASSYGSAVDER